MPGSKPERVLLDKIRDIEEKQRIIKNRLLLIGQNMIELREQTDKELLEIKNEVKKLNMDLGKVTSYLKKMSDQISKMAKMAKIRHGNDITNGILLT